MQFTPVPNHPECHRWFLGVNGPIENKHKLIITKERSGWCWRWKPPTERHYTLVGPVERFPNPFPEIRMIQLVGEIY
jgi:hypothetical protein